MSDELTPAARYGALFVRVQESAILADGKAFVDAVPRRCSAAIMADFVDLPAGDEALRHFVEANFDLPVSADLIAVETPLQALRTHIRAMWTDLARAPLPGEPGSSALAIAHRHVVPGGRFREIYYWDSYFTMLGLIGDGERDLARGIVDAMTDLIERYGYVPNGTRNYYLGRSQPPLYHLMVGLLDDPDPVVGARRLAAMKREHAWWMAGAEELPCDAQHGHVVRLADGSLLNRYWDAHDTPREESWREDVETARISGRPAAQVCRDLRAGAESGWDFSSRWLDSDDLSSIRTTTIVPVDLNAFLFGLESVIAASSDAEAPAYADRAERRRVAMHAHLWNADTGYFADYDLSSERHRPHATAAALAPLFVGIATHFQAAATARFAAGALLAPGGLRTTTITSGEQWDSPNGWAPLQWIAVVGLSRYGHDDLADEIARRWIATVDDNFRATGLLYEKYDVERAMIGRGGEYVPQIGFGWTNGVTAAFIDERRAAGVTPAVRPAFASHLVPTADHDRT